MLTYFIIMGVLGLGREILVSYRTSKNLSFKSVIIGLFGGITLPILIIIIAIQSYNEVKKGI